MSITRSRPRFAVTLCALALLLAPAAVAAPQDGPDQEVARAVDELSEGKISEAVKRLERVLEEHSDHVGALYYAGMGYAQQGETGRALEHFVRAGELQPGLGDAHYRATLLAWERQDYELAWEQAILAAQAGFEMDQAFAELRQMAPPPDDFERRINAPRVLLGAIDTEAVANRDSTAFTGRRGATGGVGADSRGSTGDPFGGEGGRGSGPRTVDDAVAIGTGAGLAGELSGEFAEVRRQFGQGLVRSSEFGVVPDPDTADWVLFIKVDEVSDDEPRTLIGFVKLFDYDTDTEIYSRPLELSNIASVSDLRRDIDRYIGYLERWLEEESPNR